METKGDGMTGAIDKEGGEVVGAGSRGICSVCGSQLLPGQPVSLDAKPYSKTHVGSDWSWHHTACATTQARPE
jgi:hypothetical protein